jgi:hypothetical protein
MLVTANHRYYDVSERYWPDKLRMGNEIDLVTVRFERLPNKHLKRLEICER